MGSLTTTSPRKGARSDTMRTYTDAEWAKIQNAHKLSNKTISNYLKREAEERAAMSDTPMRQIYDTISSLEKQVESIHVSIADSLRQARNLLLEDEPNIWEAIEAIEDALKELRG